MTAMIHEPSLDSNPQNCSEFRDLGFNVEPQSQNEANHETHKSGPTAATAMSLHKRNVRNKRDAVNIYMTKFLRQPDD